MKASDNPQNTTQLASWQKEFIDFAIAKGVLRFGQFTLKSGRQSPYFFNAGHFDDGESQQKLGEIYAKTLIDADIPFDLIFGPAYKGIPLATSTVYALHSQFQQNIPFAFNRKEKKAHGEGGSIVGAPIKGKIVLVDDVITAGTAIKETLSLLQDYPEAKLVAAIVLIDRQEKLNDSALSAIQALQNNYGIRILAALRFDQILTYIQTKPEFSEYVEQMLNYRAQYGATIG